MFITTLLIRKVNHSDYCMRPQFFILIADVTNTLIKFFTNNVFDEWILLHKLFICMHLQDNKVAGILYLSSAVYTFIYLDVKISYFANSFSSISRLNFYSTSIKHFCKVSKHILVMFFVYLNFGLSYNMDDLTLSVIFKTQM